MFNHIDIKGENMKKYQGTVAESLLPTFENVTREFIILF